jgi:hypothetical protein
MAAQTEPLQPFSDPETFPRPQTLRQGPKCMLAADSSPLACFYNSSCTCPSVMVPNKHPPSVGCSQPNASQYAEVASLPATQSFYIDPTVFSPDIPTLTTLQAHSSAFSSLSSQQNCLRISTLNIRGAARLKWPSIKQFFNKSNLDILCIQESKVTTTEWSYITSKNVLSVSADCSNKRKGGMAVVTRMAMKPLFKQHQPHPCNNNTMSKVQLVEVQTEHLAFMLVNIHAPNNSRNNNKYFSKTLPKVLHNIPLSHLLLWATSMPT